MNILTIVMACFSLVGALDLLTGNHFRLGSEFERGFRLLGTMALSTIGMIVMAPLISHYALPALQGLSEMIPFDPASLVGLFLANDMGGSPLASEFGKTEMSGYFNGLVIAAMMGATISFTLPFAMNEVKKEQHDDLLLGLLCGIAVIPVGCLISAIMVKMPWMEILVNMAPLLFFCVLIMLGLLFAPKVCTKIFDIFALIIRGIILVGLATGIFEFLTGWKLLPYTASVSEGVDVIFNTAAVLTGTFPLMALISRLLSRPLKALGRALKINEIAAMGLIATLATNVTTIGTMKHMDSKGVVLNSAFAVSAAFTFGGHLAYTMSVNAVFVPAVIVGKLVAGILSVFLALFIYGRVRKGTV